MWLDVVGNRTRDRRLALLRLVPLFLLAGCGPSDSQQTGSAADVTITSASSSSSAAAAATETGRLLYAGTCSTCHGPRGQGMPHQGANLRVSPFVARSADDQLVAFLKTGRTPADPQTTQGLLMPPRGGNPALDDSALASIVTFLRQLQRDEHADSPPVAQLGRE